MMILLLPKVEKVWYYLPASEVDSYLSNQLSGGLTERSIMPLFKPFIGRSPIKTFANKCYYVIIWTNM